MGRFHYHADGTGHSHDDDEHDHDHEHDDDHEHHSGEANGVGDHSGYQTGGLRVDVLEKILGENDRTAEANRSDFHDAGVQVVNLMSSPGAGKTTLLREVLLRLGESVRVGIVEGDVETSIDADRLAGLGAPVSLVNTSNGFGGECHLDATMVRSALPRLPLADLDVIVIENVGNLVCPAEFDVGEHARAMVFSITEGEEKPLKYPVMFRSADVVIVNKMDLLPYLDFDLDLFISNLRDVNPNVRTIETSAKTGLGVDEVCEWISSLSGRE
ncbi:MAG TPA: hydrogenase nickel incorporation protein HypB [Ilumatobacteraceae bacterium]